jgi:hypothetical protein
MSRSKEYVEKIKDVCVKISDLMNASELNTSLTINIFGNLIRIFLQSLPDDAKRQARAAINYMIDIDCIDNFTTKSLEIKKNESEL